MQMSSPSDKTASSYSFYAGTLLICCALLAFEISTVRTINFTIGPSYIFIAISMAMLGLTAAGSLLSLFDLSGFKDRREIVLACLCVVIAAFLVLSNFIVADVKEMLNTELRQAGEAKGLLGIANTLLLKGSLYALRVGAFLTLPYFFFGSVLSYVFATSRTQEYSRLYAADLLGAAVGCVAIVGMMEFTSYSVSTSAPAICALAAGAVFALPAKRGISLAIIVFALLLGVVTQNSAYQSRIVPKADTNYLVRDYSMRSEQVERWSGWNSFTRVGAIEHAERPGERAVLSLANGDGMAFLYPNDPNRTTPLRHHPIVAALLPGIPDSALVVFAGAGADLMSLKEHGVSTVVGVELNKKVLEAGLALPDYRLAEFLELDGVSLEIDEARSFLERDKRRYDLVLISWSGATVSYYVGALGGTTQYLFTYEGLSAILDRVSASGYAVVLQSNKLDTLEGLRRYMATHSLPKAERAAIVLYHLHLKNSNWDGDWDDNPLLIKTSGWSDAEVAEIKSKAAEQGFGVAYAPGIETHPSYLVYERVLTTGNLSAEINSISNEAGKRFGVASDDRPFYLDHFKAARYFSSDFWSPWASANIERQEINRYQQVVFVMMITVIAFILALAPLVFKREKLASRRRSATFLCYFILLGAGFMFIEIALIQRTSILFGNPGLTIAIVLSVIITSTGLGSLMSNWSFSRGLSIKWTSLLVVVFAIAAALSVPPLINAAIGLTLLGKVVTVILVVAPGGVIMGHLFPQGLAIAGEEDKSLIPWAWAINGAMSASVASVAPLVAQATGFTTLFYIGAALYAGVLILPLARPN